MAERQPGGPLFGISITPSAQNPQLVFNQARLADDLQLNMISIQDHPYNAAFLETWTLLSALGSVTQHVRLLPNVANLPLRPPAILAKSAATLDILTNGRVELGLGAGGFWDGIAAYGGPRRAPGEAVDSLVEAMQVMHALWQPADADKRTVSFSGKYYQLNEAQPGPAPRHPIGIWLGALGPRMLRITGQLADGWIPSTSYVPPAEALVSQNVIDEAAQQAGRRPTDIHRAYNIMGIILKPGAVNTRTRRPGVLVGPVSYWVDELTRYYHDIRMDSFHFWPRTGEEEAQIRMFAEEVIPAVRKNI
jgi:alkanesulfonate monooxygenase SsuD/methylene tetrahydromethanopterin reductase-like flavin-dependent oxidoreductase (luciferase family)